MKLSGLSSFIESNSESGRPGVPCNCYEVGEISAEGGGRRRICSGL